MINNLKLSVLTLYVLLLGCGQNQLPRVGFQTSLGDFEAELYAKAAPRATANFLPYIDEGRFEGTSFYRTVRLDNQPNNAIKIESIQGGLKDDEHPLSLPSIPHETTAMTGILHRDGVTSMARNEPGTASSEFFICSGDQPELNFGGRRNPDDQGFAAFGRLIKGMEVVRAIHRQPAEGQWLKPIIPFKVSRIKSRNSNR